MFKDESLIPWKVIAKDGRDLPPVQIETAPADIFLTVGATCDVELQVDKPGNYSLLASSDGFQGVTMQAFTFTLPKQP
jgi:FtsP/CotA-like multicopper oxidase with cupredoxin domain